MAYQPISCDYYDELEIIAMRHRVVSIKYLDAQQQEQSIQSTIKTLKTLDKVEYLVLPDDTKIQLDHLIEVDGKALVLSCGHWDTPTTKL